MPTKKVKKMKSEEVIVGVESDAPFRTFEDIEAEKKFRKFGASTKEEYSDYVKNLTGSDLYQHASKIGFRPNGNDKLLKINLQKEFDASLSAVKSAGVFREPKREAEGIPQNTWTSREDFIKQFLSDQS